MSRERGPSSLVLALKILEWDIMPMCEYFRINTRLQLTKNKKNNLTQPETQTQNREMNTQLYPVMKAISQASLLLLTTLILSSCNSKGGLDGTYASSVQSYTFHGDTADASIMGKNIGVKWPYTVDGKSITLQGPGGNVVLTINDDGSLSDPANDKLVKK